MTNIVTAKGLHIVREGKVVLRPSDFTIPEAKITAVIGPNGSGKSTVLHAIAGLLPSAGGTLEVLGQTPAKARSQIAYVLQHMNVNPGTPMTVVDVVSMARYPLRGFVGRFRPEDKAAVSDAMELLGITDLANSQVFRLSGGQRQRVFVAQALAQEHTILLMDEPLTGLDIHSAQTIDDIIHDEPARGCSVVFTTHDLEEARAADHVVLMSGGVVASGPPDDVLSAANLAKAYGLGLLHPENTSDLGIIDDGHNSHHSHESDH
jgi:iron complex transport system ATP-binding protein